MKHPLGIALLSASMLFALVAALEITGDDQEGWLLLWGLASYGAVSIYITWRGDNVSSASPMEQPVLADPVDMTPSPDILHLAEAALRHIGSPAFLAGSGLISQLPCSIAAAAAEAKIERPTPLEEAQLLRSVLTRSIEKLRHPDGEAGAGEKESLLYHILHEHYVIGRPATYTMTRHSIAEATFHRYRREAVKAIAEDMAAQERMLARPMPIAP
jgi:hypothetical protein